MARILIHIHALRTGGAERVALQFAAWLLEAGHTVVLLTPCGVPADVFALPPGLDRRWGPPDRGLACLPGVLGFPFKVLALAAWLRRERFDLAIGMTTLPAVKLLLAARGGRVPVVVAERVYPGGTPLRPPWNWLRRLTYPRAALHLVQTEAVGQWLQQRGLARRFAVLANAIPWPIPSHSPRVDPANQLPPELPVLLAVGTKPHQKGFDLLVRAFAAASRQVPGWRLVIAGLPEWPADWPPPPAAADPLLLGRVGNLAEWYQRADLFVLSSRFEGLPNVLLEAMASGCPCVALDCPTGPAELIDHRHNGWLVPAAPPEARSRASDASTTAALAAALAELMADPQKRRHLAANAEAVRERFGEPRLRRRFLALLEPWLAPSPPS